MAATLADQLDSVQTAIAAIEGGAQSYTINGRSFTRADLATLYAREERILTKIERDSNTGGMRTVAEF